MFTFLLDSERFWPWLFNMCVLYTTKCPVMHSTGDDGTVAYHHTQSKLTFQKECNSDSMLEAYSFLL